MKPPPPNLSSYRSPRAAVTQSQPVEAFPSSRGKGIPVWILVPVTLALAHLVGTEIMPILRNLLIQLLVLAVYAFTEGFVITPPGALIVAIGFAIVLALQTLLIYGAWTLSRTRRLSLVILVGLLFVLETVVSRSWNYSFNDAPLWYVLAFPLLTASATAISYAWARKSLRASASTTG